MEANHTGIWSKVLGNLSKLDSMIDNHKKYRFPLCSNYAKTIAVVQLIVPWCKLFYIMIAWVNTTLFPLEYTFSLIGESFTFIRKWQHSEVKQWFSKTSEVLFARFPYWLFLNLSQIQDSIGISMGHLLLAPVISFGPSHTIIRQWKELLSGF